MTQNLPLRNIETLQLLGVNYQVFTSKIFSQLILEDEFRQQCLAVLQAMTVDLGFDRGKTNVKINGNYFLLAIHQTDKKIYLFSQNLVYESANQFCEFERSFDLRNFHEIPEIYLACLKDRPWQFIELNGLGKTKFLEYKKNIIHHLKNYKFSFFERLNNQILGLICDHQILRSQLLKFIAVVPALTFDKSGIFLKNAFLETANNITNHKKIDSQSKLPFFIALFFNFSRLCYFLPSPILKKLVEFNISFIARRFICTEDKNGASVIISQLHKTGRNCTLDQLGELVICTSEADDYCKKILDLINSSTMFPSSQPLNQAGIPYHHVSIKTSALTPHFLEDPEAFLFTYNDICPRLQLIFSAAQKNNVFLNFDAEHYHYRDVTVKLIFYFLEQNIQFKDFKYFGFVLQAYLKDSINHFETIKSLASPRKHLIPIRLVKGAYWDAETIEAKVKNYSSPQFLNKVETDIQYRHLIHLLLENNKTFQLCVASHNVDDHCYAEAVRDTVYPLAPIIEHQTLHMTYEPLSMACILNGWPMRNYLPTGSLLVGMGYLVRRIMENASQTGVLTAVRHHNISVEDQPLQHILREKVQNNKYISDPALREIGSFYISNSNSRLFLLDEQIPFSKASFESLIYTNLENNNGVEIFSKLSTSKLLGKVFLQNEQDALRAIEKGNIAKISWLNTSSIERAQFLRKTAQLMRLQKFALTKLIMAEAGKTIQEALGDVDEAIDFLNFYAAETHHNNTNETEPLGVFAVIAPWNFPLAILCGMTAAALASGNVVIMKPAEQTPLIALALHHIFLEASVPADVIQILIGTGEIVGEALVKNKDVHGIAFTGSKKVGVHIYRKSLQVAYQTNSTLRRVIAELGGKNAIIIDKDAELDHAITSSIYSAFAHAGQKCSACSRIIVHSSILEIFTKRFVARANEIHVGFPDISHTYINPLISKAEINSCHIKAKRMVAFSKKHMEIIHLNKTDQENENLIGPLIIQANKNSLLDLEHPIFQEMFAPLIYIVPFETEAEAVEIFNNTNYGLTGGAFTQSDNTIDRLSAKLKAGNLYFNRNITGARVAIEPFGGFKLSGTGPKAGGKKYLGAFQKPKNIKNTAPLPISENTGIEFGQKNVFSKKEIEQWFTQTTKHEINHDISLDPAIEPLYPIPGQTTYLDFKIKKEEVVFVLQDPKTPFSIIQLIILCASYQIKYSIFCLSNESSIFIKASPFDCAAIHLGLNEFSKFEFSDKIDLVIHDNHPSFTKHIYQIFANEIFYKTKLLKIIDASCVIESLPIMELAKLLCEPRTIAINTMRYGAPLDAIET